MSHLLPEDPQAEKAPMNVESQTTDLASAAADEPEPIRNPLLREAILKTLVFFDLFDFPLTIEEIIEHLYQYPRALHIKEVQGTLDQMEEHNEIEQIKDHVVLKGRVTILETRRAHKFISEKLWTRVSIYVRYLARLPFVRMVAVCNNLSYDNPNEQSDIDLFIVIESGRMWLARFMITVVLHFFGVRRHGNHVAGRFCLSFFVTEKKLAMKEISLEPEDPYLAYWAQVISPVYGGEVYKKFIQENQGWLKEKYGLQFHEKNIRRLYHEGRTSKTKSALEWILSGLLGNLVEKLLQLTFKKRTLAHMKTLGAQASVIVSDEMLKFHNEDRRRVYAEKWRKSLSRFEKKSD